MLLHRGSIYGKQKGESRKQKGENGKQSNIAVHRWVWVQGYVCCWDFV